MLLSSKNLLGLPAETESGVKLGHVSSFDFDPETMSIVRYYVRPKRLIKGFTEGELVIHKSQILSLNEKKMVVEDLAVKSLASAKPKLAEAL